MEGHPKYEDPGAMPAPGRVESSGAARKRVFLLLDAERRSLTAHVRPSWRPSGRYEDLSLVMILARRERDWLSQPSPDLSGGDDPKGQGGQPGPTLADWAKPWGAAPRIKLDADIGRVDGALKGIGRWLPARTAAKAQGRARERLEAITAQVEERGPQARAADAPQGGATKRRGFGRPSRTGVAAIAGFLLLVAGAGAFLLASNPGSGPGDSVGRRGAVAGVRQHPGTLDTRIQGGSGHSQGARQSASPPGHAGTKGSAGARPPGPGQSAPVASETVPRAPQPPPVAQPVAAPEPTPASQPAPAPAPSSSTSSQSKSAGGGGGCPPEFGYEC